MEIVMPSLEPIHPVMIVNQTGTDYIVRYKNQWIDGKSRCVSRKTVGKLVGNKVVFGRKFLSENPQYKGVEAIYQDHEIIFLDPTEEKLTFTEFASKARACEAVATYVLDNIAEQSGLTADLQAVFPSQYRELLSLAMFLILQPHSSVCSFESFANRTYLLTEQTLNPTAITRLFQSISDEQRFSYLKRRAAHSQTLVDGGYWAFDTTSISSFSKTIRKVKYGKNKEEDSLPQFNIALLLDEISGEPVFYKVLDGSLNDCSLLRNLFLDLTQLDLDPIQLILDRGFFSLNNLTSILKQDIGFVIGAKRNSSFIQATMKRALPALRLCHPRAYREEVQAFCYTEAMPWVINTRASGRSDQTVYIHVYFSKQKETDDIENTLQALTRSKQKAVESGQAPDDPLFRRFYKKDSLGQWELDEMQWAQFRETAGLIVLMSNTVKDAAAALLIYRNRDTVEKAFCNYKDRCSGRRMKCEEKALEGKVFVTYLALSLLLMLKKRLSDKKLPSDSTPKYLDTLSGIKLWRLDGTFKRYWDEISKSNRELILSAGVDLPKNII